MRTTIELTDSQRERLLVLARRRGMRGFSEIVQEALDAYLSDLDRDEVDALLSLEGSIGEEQAAEMERRIEKARGTWRAS